MARTAISQASRSAAPAGAPKKRSIDEARVAWAEAFRRVRAETEARASHLSAEDQIVQSMADATPTKWHRAHVTWFFEQFLLVPNDPGLQDFRRAVSVSVQLLLRRRRSAPRAPATRPDHAAERRGRRGLSRPCRRRGRAADRQCAGGQSRGACSRFSKSVCITSSSTRNCSLTDILHAFAQNPTDPVYDADWQPPRATQGPRGFVDVPAGIHSIGHEGQGLLLRQRDAVS